RLRRGYLLPPGATVEEQAEQQDVWTYAVATAAMLHDIAKPLADQRIQLFDRRGKATGEWNPWSGPMPEDALYYKVGFRRKRQYRLHERAALLLAHHIVPADGMRWLTSNPELLQAWLAAVAHAETDAGPVGEIIAKADGMSVATDLAGVQGRMPG